MSGFGKAARRIELVDGTEVRKLSDGSKVRLCYGDCNVIFMPLEKGVEITLREEHNAQGEVVARHIVRAHDNEQCLRNARLKIDRLL